MDWQIWQIDETTKKFFDANHIKYEGIKEQVKLYLQERYQQSKLTCAVSSLTLSFQMKIGVCPPEILVFWLKEWGYQVDNPVGKSQPNPDGSYNYRVFLQEKSLKFTGKYAT